MSDDPLVTVFEGCDECHLVYVVDLLIIMALEAILVPSCATYRTVHCYGLSVASVIE